ncbi:MAG: DmpA family aminopeptidase [Gaiellales bacterium]
MTTRPRARDLGIAIGSLPTGPGNAITDVAGVLVGHTTLVHGEGPLRAGQGPVRTGVTVILPHGGDVRADPLFAGCHRLNGNGELTGLEWVRESGLLGSPVALTNTHSVGVVRDALIAHATRDWEDARGIWFLPVVGETFDGYLNDVNGMHVRPEHVWQALESASPDVAEGSVGGGTGMICHGFKGGIGTASRIVEDSVVGVLVQANHGERERLSVNGVPVGRRLADVPAPDWDTMGRGSIIVIAATDAPLLPMQCARLAQRAALGVARSGGAGENGSGDLMLAFSTANRGLGEGGDEASARVEMLRNDRLDPLFHGVIEAVEEAILNAMLASPGMTGRDGVEVHGLEPDMLLEAMA